MRVLEEFLQEKELEEKFVEENIDKTITFSLLIDHSYILSEDLFQSWTLPAPSYIFNELKQSSFQACDSKLSVVQAKC